MPMMWLWLLLIWGLISPSTAKTAAMLPSYNICNGMSDQLLQHASAIAWLIQYKKGDVIVIPDHFIVESVQLTDVPVTPTPANSIPLSSVFDTRHLLTTIQSLGAAHVELAPWDFSSVQPQQNTTNSKAKAAASKATTTSNMMKCIQFRMIANSDPQLVLQVLRAFRPSAVLQEMVDTILSSLSKIKSYSNNISEGVCLHHRDGQDWHDHCDQWGSSTTSVKTGKIYRGNCLGVLPHQNFVKSLQVRGLSSRKDDGSNNRWAYYCGDHQVPEELQDSKAGFAVVSRWDLDLDYDPKDRAAVANTIALDKSTISETTTTTTTIATDSHPGRGIWPLVSFFVCQKFDTFVGNSVSTFSALQIALRGGEDVYWYNSQGIPLSTYWEVFPIPLVYTYTELSESLGKTLIKTSITTARQHMPETPIHILYHGTYDTLFRDWLTSKAVKIHQHEPSWRGKIETMRRLGNNASSHLFLHSGNFFGTWQRIDIPLFLNTEYCIYLDADTLIARPFTMADFGLNLTYGLAMSDEADINSEPYNAGVTLMNIPLLREKHRDYLEFIWDHIQTGGQFNGTQAPSDQGAASVFFQKHLRFLEREFNMKPYWPKEAVEREPFIWHFHGAKPQDYISHALGQQCPYAYEKICYKIETPNVCAAFQAFGRAAIAAEILDGFCQSSFPRVERNAKTCVLVVQKMAVKGEPCRNMKMKVNILFKKLEVPDTVVDNGGQGHNQGKPSSSVETSVSVNETQHDPIRGRLDERLTLAKLELINARGSNIDGDTDFSWLIVSRVHCGLTGALLLFFLHKKRLLWFAFPGRLR